MKARRISQACDFCHRRGLKCRQAPSEGQSPLPSCLTCLEYGQDCTRHRQPRKRGTKPKGPSTSKTATIPSPGHRRETKAPGRSPGFGDDFGSFGTASSLPNLRHRKTVTTLLDVYLDSIHPMFPFFCERELWVGWRDGTFPQGASEYMSLVCMCALSAHHVGSGALFTDDEPLSNPAKIAEGYLTEAISLVPLDIRGTNLVDLIRSCGFLALLGSQNGDVAMVHKYLTFYHGVCAQSNFHDESKWPAQVSVCEKEVRRRLWWTMYRLEVQTCCVLGSLVRCSETQCDVGYPSGPHHPAFIPGRDGQFEDWFSGWNLTTDLYRILEHAVSNFRSTRRKHLSIFPEYNGTDTESMMKKLSEIQERLLPHFGAASAPSADSGRNRCGFQACTILCVIHLARMITCLSREDSLSTACQTARDMMESMNAIPPEYVRASASGVLQQLVGVGHMLLGVARKHALSQSDVLVLRDVLGSIISFLNRFSEYSKLVSVAIEKLQSQQEGLDHFMEGHAVNETPAEEDAIYDESYFWGTNLESLGLDDSHEHGFFSVGLLRAFPWPPTS